MDPKTMDFVEGGVEEQAIQAEYIYQDSTLITLLRVPYLGRNGSTKLVLPKWHKYSTLNRVIRVLTMYVHKFLGTPCKACGQVSNANHNLPAKFYEALDKGMELNCCCSTAF